MNILMRKMMKRSLRLISIMLAIVLMMETGLRSGNIVLADPVTESVNNIQEEIPESETVVPIESESVITEENPQILFEVESLREQNEKHYRLSDGTMMAAEYAMDVHYENENGEWTEIDNRFIYEPATETDAMEGYATADGAVEFKFAPDTSGEIVRAADGKHFVSFELITEEVEPEMEDLQVSEEVLEETENVENVSSEGIPKTESIGIEKIEIENTDMEEIELYQPASGVPITFIGSVK